MAEVHDITFENIRVELESFYTMPALQRTEEQVYDKYDEIEIAKVLSIKNKRYREKLSFLGFTHEAESISLNGKPLLAEEMDVRTEGIAADTLKIKY